MTQPNDLPPVGVAPAQHAALGASSAHRWMLCPGSVRMEAPLASTTSVHAEEGTAAHTLAELCLREQRSPEDFIGTTINGRPVDEEMAESVQVFVDYCCSLATQSDEHWIEQRINLAPLNPPAPMFGTLDFGAYHAASQELEIVDLKYGRGVLVEVEGNKQARYYAIGAWLQLGGGRAISQVKITIVQPRAAHTAGPVRSEVVSVAELLDFVGTLFAAAAETQRPDAPLVAGDHCRFCKASAICPAQQRLAEQVAMVEFAALPADQPPAPDTIPLPTLLEMMQQMPILEAWIKACYAHVEGLLLSGYEVPGYKLVQRRATRKWIDPDATLAVLRNELHLPEDEILDMSLKSPAQLEKLLGRRRFAALEPSHVVKQSSGVTMVPSTDVRPAVAAAAIDEFPALPPGASFN